MRHERPRHAFTLIELLVVIAIIALLIGILLPALGAARRSAWTAMALNNARQVNLGVVTYTTDNKGFIPPSYVYPKSEEIDDYGWDMSDQRDPQPNRQYGYIHWSYALFGNGEVPEEAFESPVLLNGGAPRTNPGPDPENWEPGQIDKADGATAESAKTTDRQVARLAFGGNGALFPRNKFNQREFGGFRNYVLVKDNVVEFPAKTILIAEFGDSDNDWRLLAREVSSSDDGNWTSGSHRPFTPFMSFSGDGLGDPTSVGNTSRAAFRYMFGSEILDVDNGDRIQAGIFSRDNGLNVFSREHSGKGVTGYIDGHAELRSLRETILGEEWGRRFYSISGNNDVWTPDEMMREGVWEDN